MTRADFYIVAEHNTPYRFICNLSDKVRQEGYDLYIHASSKEQASTLDDMLWTFRDISFLAHALADSPEADNTPIIIGWEGGVYQFRQVLMNLSNSFPGAIDSYGRIIEVVPSDPNQREKARQRYKDYRDKGLELHSHNIESGNA